VPIIPTFGNNDWLRNYAPPTSSEISDSNKFVPYEYLYELWLKNNEQYLTGPQIKAMRGNFTGYPNGLTDTATYTSASGGWYEYPLNDEISVMCINSIFWSDSGV
jgi:hypothetical protein